MNGEFHIFFTVSQQKEYFSLSSPFEMKVCIRQGVNVLAFTGPVLGWLVIKSVCCCFNIFIFCPPLSELCFFFSLFMAFKRASDISSARCFIQHRHTLSAFSQIVMYYIQNYYTDYSKHYTALEIHECTQKLLHFSLTQITVALLSRALIIDFEQRYNNKNSALIYKKKKARQTNAEHHFVLYSDNIRMNDI